LFPSTPNKKASSIEILGVRFDALTLQQLVHEVKRSLIAGERTRLAFANPEFCVVAQNDIQLLKYLNNCDFCLADGVGVLWAAKFYGSPLPERVTGTDFVYELSRMLEQQGFSLFLYGGSPRVAEEAALRLKKLFPDLKIAGCEDGYQENGLTSQLVNNIVRLKPDVLMVCLGNPKQERWIEETAESLPVKVIFGNGGAMDFTAGRVSRAPNFFISTGSEWVWRLMQDFTITRVRRLLRLPAFVFMVLKERLSSMKG